MANQEYGPKRCRDTRKPTLSDCPHVYFYRLQGQILVQTSMMDTGIDTTVNNIEILIPQLADTCDKIQLSYKITGGYNDNTVLVSWVVKDKAYIPEWIYLKTFTGGYMKYIFTGKRPPMRFALADLDAFAYCDKDPCLACTFRCKRGFEIYVYQKEIGLLVLPMEYFSPYWESNK